MKTRLKINGIAYLPSHVQYCGWGNPFSGVNTSLDEKAGFGVTLTCRNLYAKDT